MAFLDTLDPAALLFPSPSLPLFETCEQKCMEDKLVMEQLTARAISAACGGKPFVELEVLGLGAAIIEKASAETALHIQGNERKAIMDRVKEGKGSAILRWVECLAKTLGSARRKGYFGMSERDLLIIVPASIKTLAQLLLKACPGICGLNAECEASREINDLTNRFVQLLMPRLSLPLASPSRAVEAAEGGALLDLGLREGDLGVASAGASLMRDAEKRGPIGGLGLGFGLGL